MSDAKSSYSMPALPPSAHTTSKHQESIVSNQPLPASGMVVRPDAPARGEQTTDGPMRLRGGCIPCPNGGCCYIIPIPCCF
ncbi:hypothetical protein Moror_16378 [Moniliophthora roreri MCA 2997]|uniref:Uncharacterized protein n=2 Tax=Moniliophthora roreri TaxID=221103 RepID=V2XEN8_MONRO|nr:hypothetical protein Moror_16378 [Moniliophthora roreri MCA 2997]KAI3601406.1 hypothetical protein WG66_002567 [Moniliophthora roreri]